MSYDQFDAARDEMYERLEQELYPGHKDQAISEFTTERLCSFYVANPKVMQPADGVSREGKKLLEEGHYAAAVIFFVSAIELYLKATLLKPVVYGLVHNEGLADIIVEHALGQAGFDRYDNLLSKLFSELAQIELKSIVRENGKDKLLAECTILQKLRNRIIHQGSTCSKEQADLAHAVSDAVYDLIVTPMFFTLGLIVVGNAEIQQRPITSFAIPNLYSNP